MVKHICVFVIMLLLFSCNSSHNKNQKESPNHICDQIEEDSLITLKGTLHINSKDTFVFENVDKRNVWQRKIHLIPCSDNLKDYVVSTYDSYLYLKSFEEKFWVSVDGKYFKTDTLEFSPQFLFNFVAIIDEIEVETDSSQGSKDIKIE